jgi:hypothetical protein
MDNSNGHAQNSIACACNNGFLWEIKEGVASCTALADSDACNIATSIIIGGKCFACSNDPVSKGTAKDG